MAKTPSYSVAYTSTKIPVSKHLGSLWKGRVNAAIRCRKEKLEKSWQEAIDYYNHDHSSTKQDRYPGFDNTEDGRVLGSNRFDETENVVYANVNAIIPRVYMKNPTCEITPNYNTNPELDALKTVGERLVNVLANKEVAPGFNLKNKAKRCVVWSELTNLVWAEVDYQNKEQSSEQALADIVRISEQLQKAKSPGEIEKLEGQLMAMEKKIQLASPSGPVVRVRTCFDVVVDPDSEDDDHMDAKWIAVREYVPTSWLNACYGMDKKGKQVSVYSPTHILSPTGTDSVQDEVNSFNLFGEDRSYKDYGYESEEEYDAAKRTCVWKVWDKTTRRLFLFHAKEWTMPIWVWDDPTQLDRFFPLVCLRIYTSPRPIDSRGEVSYYLDQQDAINEINQEEKAARQWVRRNIFYNSNLVDQDTAMSVLKGANGEALGIPLPPDVKVGDVFDTLKPPSLNFPEVFNKQSKLVAIDRISRANQILRGGEFKTNTTNMAIQAYNSVQTGTLDEHIDQVEDFIGKIFWMVLQLCLMNMSKQEVEELIGPEAGAAWRNMDPTEILTSFSVQVVGGSTLKPTSQVKQEQAMNLGQILGQFSAASPVAFLVAVRAFERAFDEVTVTEEDWAMIRQAIEAQISAPQGQPTANPEGGGGAEGGTDLQSIVQAVNNFPPEAKQALADAIAQGAPIEEAVVEIMNTLQGAQNARPQ